MRMTNAVESRENYSKFSRAPSPPNAASVQGVKNFSPKQKVFFVPNHMYKLEGSHTASRKKQTRKFANCSMINFSKCTSERNLRQKQFDKSFGAITTSFTNIGSLKPVVKSTQRSSVLGDMLGILQTDIPNLLSPLNGTSVIRLKLPELCHVPTPHELTGKTYADMPQNVRPKYKSNIAKRQIEKNFARRYYEKKGLKSRLSPTSAASLLH